MSNQRFFSIDDLSSLPKPQWLIDGLFELNSLVMVVGPPGAFKSFLAIDWALSMATKRKWNGRDTVQQKVLYVLGEGKSNLLKRLDAWTHYHQLEPSERTLLNENFRVSFDVPQLASPESVTMLQANLEAENFKPEVIVIDTFARSFVGMDENDAKDAGMWIERADKLRKLGYTVIFLHHTVKNTSEEFGGVRYRGSSAIMGAMDTAFNFVKDKDDKNISTLSCSKQKDHDDEFKLYFKRLKVQPPNSLEDSIVLVPTIKLDERFTPEFQEKEAKVKSTIANLMLNTTYKSDWERARELSRETGLSEAAAQSRITRARRGEAPQND